MVITDYQGITSIEIGSRLAPIEPRFLRDGEFIETGQTLVTNHSRSFYALVTLKRGIVVTVQ